MEPAEDVQTRPHVSGRPPKLRLGDVLLQQQLISHEHLSKALELQRSTGKKLGRLLIDAGAISEEALAHVLARQLSVPFVNLKTFPVKTALVRLLPESSARRFRALVLEDRGDFLLVAFADPLDLFAFDELSRQLKRRVAMAVVAESQLPAMFDRHYRRSEEISGLARALERDVADAVDFGALQASVGQDAAPVVKLLQSVFEDAVQAGASDLHVEPQEAFLLIRSRIDGVLQILTQADRRIAAALAQRLKLMAGLDIAERRLPQDGRFTVRLRDRNVEVRLSTMPDQHGECLAMRLLDHGASMRGLDDLGMPAWMLERFRALLAKDTGLVLVTGPTGSGKTTTLYAALSEVDAVAHKIITVEDPVEYRLPGLTQVQVNDRIELNFARVLRSALRQDPDVILVGEMRDQETVEIGLRAAITGHLVMSTLHTRDVVSTPFRLLDMGAPPYMVASSLQAVVAQRLLRAVCPHCVRPHLPTPRERAWLESVMGEAAGAFQAVKGEGCPHCHGNGYLGRLGVYEMLEISADMALAIQQSDASAFKRLANAEMAGRMLEDQCLNLLQAGRTTLAEAMRVSFTLEA
jgi:MSHA biogenesis protein MshE